MIDLSFFRGKRIFLTGHTGFKGSWLCRILVGAGAELTGYGLPSPTDPNLFALCGVADHMTSVMGDMTDMTALQAAYNACQPDIVIHMAAQPIVRVSYEHPRETYETNVMGTVNILECLRQNPCARSFLNVTTDKVYHNNEWLWGYRECDPLDGYDPYSNSKSCSELVTHSYCSSFFSTPDAPAVSTARAGNVIGGGDFSVDRIVPDCVRAVLTNQPICVRNPHSTRPYQHVLEPLCAYLMICLAQYQDKSIAGWYNVGPDDCDCLTTGQLVDLFVKTWGGSAHWIDQNDGGPHEANFLKLDCSKLKAALAWKPRWHIAEAIAQTCAFTKVWQAGGDVPAEMDREIALFIRS